MKIWVILFSLLFAGNTLVCFAEDTNNALPEQNNTAINPPHLSTQPTNGAINPLLLSPSPIASTNGMNSRYRMSPQDAADLKAQGWSDYEIANAIPVQPQPKQPALPPTPPDLKNAIIYIDDFLGNGKTGLPADIISMKKGVLKFRFGGQDYNYSGNYSILLTKPRQHKNPYFGLGNPETAKILILNGFWKGEPDETLILPNATIWENSDGFIDAVAVDKEWIHSGGYTVQK